MPEDVLVAGELSLPLRGPQQILGSDPAQASLALLRNGIQSLHLSLLQVVPGRWRCVALSPQARVHLQGTCVEPDEITHGDHLRVGDLILTLEPRDETSGASPPLPPTNERSLTLEVFRGLQHAESVPDLLEYAARSLVSLMGGKACLMKLDDPRSRPRSFEVGEVPFDPDDEDGGGEATRVARAARSASAARLSLREQGLVWMLSTPFVPPGSTSPSGKNLGVASLWFDDSRPWIDAGEKHLATAWGYLVGSELARLSRKAARPRSAVTRILVGSARDTEDSSGSSRGPPIELLMDLPPVVVVDSFEDAEPDLEALPAQILHALPLNRVTVFSVGDADLGERIMASRIGRRRGAFRQGIDLATDNEAPSRWASEVIALAIEFTDWF